MILCGPTGVGKSWLASALGHKACRDNRSVLYQRGITGALAVTAGGAPLNATAIGFAPPGERALASCRSAPWRDPNSAFSTAAFIVVHHGISTENACPVERDQLRLQLRDLVAEGGNKLLLGALTDVGCTERGVSFDSGQDRPRGTAHNEFWTR